MADYGRTIPVGAIVVQEEGDGTPMVVVACGSAWARCAWFSRSEISGAKRAHERMHAIRRLLVLLDAPA